VTWQLGAFALLTLALAAGFAWYERVRPDARIVALVGTLAAFAALGRIAFAAVPNVKPTTDIVLIAGFALGGGPGFAVGAIAGLTSNFFFGQGPWTPWQMAAWGATGVVGAGLARIVSLSARLPLIRPGLGRETKHNGAGEPPRVGRWTLALVCCVAGFAFTVVQDVGDWVTFSDHSFSQLGVYVGQGLGFDAIHAGGCLVFALAFGPALTRSIQRFATRLKVVWIPPGGVAAPLIAAALVLGLTLGPQAQAARALATAPAVSASSSAAAAASYLVRAENSDGGFGAAPGQVSDQLYAGWAALGLASAGHDLDLVARGSAGLLAYVRAGAGSLTDVGSLERTILVAGAAGLSARSFAGHDLVAELEGRIRHNGSVSGQVNLTSFAILALRSAGLGSGSRTRAWLVSQQDGDGGYGFAGAGGSSDVDDTGAALEALSGGSGTAARALAHAVAFLRRQQNRDGGFPSQPGGDSNAQSTAWAVQGLDAAGVDPRTLHHAGSVSPVGYLQSLIGPGGRMSYARGVDQTPVWVTAEGLMALEGKPLPIAPPPPPAAPVPAAPAGRPAGPRHGAARIAGPPASQDPVTAARPRRVTAVPARRRRDLGALAPGAPIARLASAIGTLTALVLVPIGAG
jgi:energy-coupling factor transport system substrate-specific component